MSNGIIALCQSLRALGVDTCFGVPGTQNVALFEGLRRTGVRTVLATSELAAAFMANGYFRASGRVAAVATIPGPGFTYALTGLAEARHDSVALLHLLGRSGASAGRKFQLQAIDHEAIIAPIVKAYVRVQGSDDVAAVVERAYEVAVGGEPGPVVIDVDVPALWDAPAAPHSQATARAKPASAALKSLRSAFEASDRPLLLLGQGALNAAESFKVLVTSLRVPVLTTPSARGILPEDDELSMCFDPLRGGLDAINALLDRSDLIVAIGAKLGHNGSAGFALRLPTERLVHIDTEESVIGANYPARLGIVASAEDAATAIGDRNRPTAWAKGDIASTREALRTPAAMAEPRLSGSQSSTAAEFFRWLRDALPRDAIVVTDSGLHQVLTRRHYDVLSPRGLIAPSDFQSMGYGVPAAIGAELGASHRPVVAVVGDGGFLMSGVELLTAKREGLQLLAIVFNDGYLNQIRLQQIDNFGHPFAVRVETPDLRALADAFGIEYQRYGECSADEIRRAIGSPGVTLLEVVVGDSPAMRLRAPVVRARSTIGRLIGRRARDWIRRLRGR